MRPVICTIKWFKTRKFSDYFFSISKTFFGILNIDSKGLIRCLPHLPCTKFLEVPKIERKRKPLNSFYSHFCCERIQTFGDEINRNSKIFQITFSWRYFTLRGLSKSYCSERSLSKAGTVI